jgi:hypothetical protein
MVQEAPQGLAAGVLAEEIQALPVETGLPILAAGVVAVDLGLVTERVVKAVLVL